MGTAYSTKKVGTLDIPNIASFRNPTGSEKSKATGASYGPTYPYHHCCNFNK
jgi:hypothetical protein